MVRNVADGRIDEHSMDAVNGRQLYGVQKSIMEGVSEVGAGTAAMANLHPAEYNEGGKISISAAVGNYKEKTVGAIGAFYRPNKKSIFSVSGTVGGSESMMGMGFTRTIGSVVDEKETKSEEVVNLQNIVEAQNKKIEQQADLVDKLKAQVEAMTKQMKEFFNK